MFLTAVVFLCSVTQGKRAKFLDEHRVCCTGVDGGHMRLPCVYILRHWRCVDIHVKIVTVPGEFTGPAKITESAARVIKIQATQMT